MDTKLLRSLILISTCGQLFTAIFAIIPQTGGLPKMQNAVMHVAPSRYGYKNPSAPTGRIIEKKPAQLYQNPVQGAQGSNQAKSSEKTGSCPPVVFMNSNKCPDLCTVDQDCAGNMKCCLNGCGKQCTEPDIMSIQNIPIDPFKSKPPSPVLPIDYSPQRKPRQKLNQVSKVVKNKGLAEKIRRKEKMLQKRKAIFRGMKDGVCPVNLSGGFCKDECYKDSQCPGIQKCCSNGCARVCLSPIYKNGRKPQNDINNGNNHGINNGNNNYGSNAINKYGIDAVNMVDIKPVHTGKHFLGKHASKNDFYRIVPIDFQKHTANPKVLESQTATPKMFKTSSASPFLQNTASPIVPKGNTNNPIVQHKYTSSPIVPPLDNNHGTVFIRPLKIRGTHSANKIEITPINLRLLRGSQSVNKLENTPKNIGQKHFQSPNKIEMTPINIDQTGGFQSGNNLKITPINIEKTQTNKVTKKDPLNVNTGKYNTSSMSRGKIDKTHPPIPGSSPIGHNEVASKGLGNGSPWSGMLDNHPTEYTRGSSIQKHSGKKVATSDVGLNGNVNNGQSIPFDKNTFKIRAYDPKVFGKSDTVEILPLNINELKQFQNPWLREQNQLLKGENLGRSKSGTIDVQILDMKGRNLPVGVPAAEKSKDVHPLRINGPNLPSGVPSAGQSIDVQPLDLANYPLKSKPIKTVPSEVSPAGQSIDVQPLDLANYPLKSKPIKTVPSGVPSAGQSIDVQPLDLANYPLRSKPIKTVPSGVPSAGQSIDVQPLGLANYPLKSKPISTGTIFDGTKLGTNRMSGAVDPINVQPLDIGQMTRGNHGITLSPFGFASQNGRKEFNIPAADINGHLPVKATSGAQKGPLNVKPLDVSSHIPGTKNQETSWTSRPSRFVGGIKPSEVRHVSSVVEKHSQPPVQNFITRVKQNHGRTQPKTKNGGSFNMNPNHQLIDMKMSPFEVQGFKAEYIGSRTRPPKTAPNSISEYEPPIHLKPKYIESQKPPIHGHYKPTKEEKHRFDAQSGNVKKVNTVNDKRTKLENIPKDITTSNYHKVKPTYTGDKPAYYKTNNQSQKPKTTTQKPALPFGRFSSSKQNPKYSEYVSSNHEQNIKAEATNKKTKPHSHLSGGFSVSDGVTPKYPQQNKKRTNQNVQAISMFGMESSKRAKENAEHNSNFFRFSSSLSKRKSSQNTRKIRNKGLTNGHKTNAGISITQFTNTRPRTGEKSKTQGSRQQRVRQSRGDVTKADVLTIPNSKLNIPPEKSLLYEGSDLSAKSMVGLLNGELHKNARSAARETKVVNAIKVLPVHRGMHAKPKRVRTIFQGRPISFSLNPRKSRTNTSGSQISNPFSISRVNVAKHKKLSGAP